MPVSISDLNAVLPGVNLNEAVNSFSMANIVAWILFGGVGFVAFMYGKKMGNFKILGIGIAIMIYPYFISNTLLLYVVGIALTAALFFLRD